MPGFTPQLVHPAAWPADRRRGLDLDRTAAQMPAFVPERTRWQPQWAGAPEALRALPDSIRSSHPHVSFVANGPRVSTTDLSEHPIEYRFSERSPLGKLRDQDAKAVLLGAPFRKSTCLHLAEYLVDYPGRRRGRWRVPVSAGSMTGWNEVDELSCVGGDFDRIGGELIARGGPVLTTRIGDADCVSFPVAEALEFACRWLPDHRDISRYADPPGWVSISARVRTLCLGLNPWRGLA